MVWIKVVNAAIDPFFQLSSSSGRLDITLKEYKNPQSRTASGSCCDGLWVCGVCDPYFKFKFKVEKVFWPTPREFKSKTFSSSNVVRFTFLRWQVSFREGHIYNGYTGQNKSRLT